MFAISPLRIGLTASLPLLLALCLVGCGDSAGNKADLLDTDASTDTTADADTNADTDSTDTNPDTGPSCDDSMANGSETDVDCGGSDCDPCGDGSACLIDDDCANDCIAGVCAVPNCMDQVSNGTETGVDCGGGDCPACANGQSCVSPTDCMSGACDPIAMMCVDPNCMDMALNGSETDVDCGGPECAPCLATGICVVETDCDSGVCDMNICQAAACSDGVIQMSAGEECDDGMANADVADACRTNCLLPACGDAILDTMEECDDGNTMDDDGCNATCVAEVCNDGIVQMGIGEECEDGNLDDDDGCSSLCRFDVCGDGITQPSLGETCDDGNTVDDDGCSATCIIEVCGDNIVQMGLGEECDDGNTVDGDGCTANCLNQTCGNGMLDPGEDVDPPVSPLTSVTVDPLTCRYDFSAMPQLYCNGTCGTWGSGNGCQQADADAFCKLKMDNPASTATTFQQATALVDAGICCPTVSASAVGCTPLGMFPDRGVPGIPVSVHDTDMLGSHGPGDVITTVVCTDP